MHVKYTVLKQGGQIPTYATQGSSGLDIRALIDSSIILAPLERAIVSTGIAIELPENYEAQIRPRSGLSAKFGITVLNSPGTIDSDYRGEIKIILINLGQENFTINSGDKVAQMVISQYKKVELYAKEKLSTTLRGDGGFGSTGV